MSHAVGECRFKDKTIYYFEYDGTSDITLPELYSNQEDLNDNWRKNIDWQNVHKLIKDAKDDSEDVELYSSYGYGFTYKGIASKKYMIITWDEVTDDTLNGIRKR